MVSRFSWVLGLLFVSTLGCNEVATTSRAPLEVRLTDFSSELPVEGARLCELDTDNCVLTDTNGEATLLLPIGRETAYTREKEGYAPWLTPVVLSEDGGFHWWVAPDAQGIAGAHAGLGSPYPMRGTGSISLGVGIVGATFELGAATGVPWYMDEEWNWSADLSATTSKGIGGFTEVTPGVVQVNLGGAADRCTVDDAWPGNTPNSLSVPVREGYVTGSGALCPLTP